MSTTIEAQTVFLRPIEVARRYGVSEKTLERWRSDGNGPVYVKLGGQVRYREEDLLRHERKAMRRATDRNVQDADLESIP